MKTNEVLKHTLIEEGETQTVEPLTSSYLP